MPSVLKEFHYRLGKTVQTNATLTAFKDTILLFSLLKFVIKQRFKLANDTFMERPWVGSNSVFLAKEIHDF